MFTGANSTGLLIRWFWQEKKCKQILFIATSYALYSHYLTVWRAVCLITPASPSYSWFWGGETQSPGCQFWSVLQSGVVTQLGSLSPVDTSTFFKSGINRSHFLQQRFSSSIGIEEQWQQEHRQYPELRCFSEWFCCLCLSFDLAPWRCAPVWINMVDH